MAEQSIAGKPDLPSGGTRTLQGRIEAIGIHELLRLSAIRGSTGMLLVFDQQTHVQLFYEQGCLVAAMDSSSQVGTECLSPVLSMTEGEFEFIHGFSAEPSLHTPGLHEAMMAATKQYFERELQSRRLARSGSPHGDPTTSGVHRVAARATARSDHGGPVAGSRVHRDAERTPPGVKASPDELGYALITLGGRLVEHAGTYSPQESVLVTLSLRIAREVGLLLGEPELVRVEVHDHERKTLSFGPTNRGIFALITGEGADVPTLWEQIPR